MLLWFMATESRYRWLKASPKFHVETPGMPIAVIDLHFVKTHFQEFAVGNRIDVGVVRAGAVPGHQERRTFVQIVHHRGMPLVKHAVDGFGGLMRLLVRVAIDIHKGVF